MNTAHLVRASDPLSSVLAAEGAPKFAQLVDDIRKKAAELAGLQMELANLLGDRDGMVRYQREMYAQTEARRAAALVRAEDRGECFFDAAGRADGDMVR